jgi:hypothetical protein
MASHWTGSRLATTAAGGREPAADLEAREIVSEKNERVDAPAVFAVVAARFLRLEG